jgi:glycosyltransferase involved in cell wall biosynthesis
MLSVIIPVFNGEKHLAESIGNIGPGHEVIVVDDGSTDASADIAEQYGANVIRLPHGGAVKARNAGLAAAKGDYIAFHDSDDLMTDGALEKMLSEIGDNDGVMAMREDFIMPDCKDKFKSNSPSFGAIAGCALFCRHVFDIVGNFDEELLCGDGYEWLMRAEKAGINIKQIPFTACMRRIHGENMGIRMKAQEYSDYCKIIRKHFK